MKIANKVKHSSIKFKYFYQYDIYKILKISQFFVTQIQIFHSKQALAWVKKNIFSYLFQLLPKLKFTFQNKNPFFTNAILKKIPYFVHHVKVSH
jgi:hypothetical protein